MKHILSHQKFFHLRIDNVFAIEKLSISFHVLQQKSFWSVDFWKYPQRIFLHMGQLLFIICDYFVTTIYHKHVPQTKILCVANICIYFEIFRHCANSEECLVTSEIFYNIFAIEKLSFLFHVFNQKSFWTVDFWKYFQRIFLHMGQLLFVTILWPQYTINMCLRQKFSVLPTFASILKFLGIMPTLRHSFNMSITNLPFLLQRSFDSETLCLL